MSGEHLQSEQWSSGVEFVALAGCTDKTLFPKNHFKRNITVPKHVSGKIRSFLLFSTEQFIITGSKKGKVNSVSVDGCPSEPCHVHKGTTYYVTVNFTASKWNFNSYNGLFTPYHFDESTLNFRVIMRMFILSFRFILRPACLAWLEAHPILRSVVPIFLQQLSIYGERLRNEYYSASPGKV